MDLSKISKGLFNSPANIEQKPSVAQDVGSIAYNPDQIEPYITWLDPHAVVNAAIRPQPAKAQPDRQQFLAVLSQVTNFFAMSSQAESNPETRKIYEDALAVFERTGANHKVFDAYRQLWLEA